MYLLDIYVSSFEKHLVHLSVYWSSLLNLLWIICCDLISHLPILSWAADKTINYMFNIGHFIFQLQIFFLSNLPSSTVLCLAFTTFSTTKCNFTISPNNSTSIVHGWLFPIAYCLSILSCTILLPHVPGYAWLCAVTVLRKWFAFIVCYWVWGCFLLEKVYSCVFLGSTGEYTLGPLLSKVNAWDFQCSQTMEKTSWRPC